MIPNKEKEKLLAAISYSDGPKKGKEAPNLLGVLLSQDIPFDRDVMYIVYCYYTCGYSFNKIKELITIPQRPGEIQDIVINTLNNNDASGCN